MTLKSPFEIGPRLAPSLRIKDTNGIGWLSFEDGQFVIDLPDGSEHVVKDFSFPRCRIAGATDESELQAGFGSMLAFLGACAESRDYAERKGLDAMSGENSDMFPEKIGQWAQQYSQEIDNLRFEIEEGEPSLIGA